MTGVRGGSRGYGVRARGYGVRARGYGVRARGYGVRARGYGTLKILVSAQGPLVLGFGFSALGLWGLGPGLDNYD